MIPFRSSRVSLLSMPQRAKNGNGFVPQPDTGYRIRERRRELGLSQRDIADGLTAAFVSRVEAGARTPSLSALIQLARELRTTALYLITGEYQSPCPVCGRTKGAVREQREHQSP